MRCGRHQAGRDARTASLFCLNSLPRQTPELIASPSSQTKRHRREPRALFVKRSGLPEVFIRPPSVAYHEGGTTKVE